jgi:flagellar basal body rod protein FlgG
VNALEEMVLMMDALRSYEAFMKLMQANDEMDSKVVNEMGKA